MADPHFYTKSGPFTVQDIIDQVETVITCDEDSSLELTGVASLNSASAGDLSFCISKKYVDALTDTKASACLVKENIQPHVPDHVICLITEDPERAFAQAASLFHPQGGEGSGISAQATIDASAKLEEDVAIGPGAIIGPEVEIGRGSSIGTNTVIGAGVRIGRNCEIQANVSIMFSIIGNHVMIQPGAVIGGDGFGYAMGPKGHLRIPQLGRVIIQDHVDVGSGSTIDRGASDDTIIGEGTKIDNLVQIGHNCIIGRHCILAGMVGLAGSTTLGDFVVLGGNAGTAGHLTIGDGAQIAGKTGVTKSLAGGQIYAGFPVKPVMQWRREQGALARLAKNKK
jgi:UDP-3-O-[3-hydroxymyristoyl] glucosamine N-acyltransferase